MEEIYKSVVSPTSEREVVNSFNTVNARLSSAPPAEVPFSTTTLAVIASFFISPEKINRNKALRNQISSTVDLDTHLIIVRKLVKHMLDELNNNIELSRGPFNSGFKALDRKYYELKVDQNTYPSLDTYAKVILWAVNMIEGEKQRIADGGVALKATTWQTLEQWYNLLLTKKQYHENMINIAKDTQVLVTEKVNFYIDKVYENMKDDIKSFYRDLPKETYRRKSKEWGLLYKEVGEDPTVFGTVNGFLNFEGIPLEDVMVTFENNGKIVHTDDTGYYCSHQVLLGFTNIKFYLEPYKEEIVMNFEVKPNIDNKQNMELKMIQE